MALLVASYIYIRYLLVEHCCVLNRAAYELEG